jgi:hypothetical protein
MYRIYAGDDGGCHGHGEGGREEEEELLDSPH